MTTLCEVLDIIQGATTGIPAGTDLISHLYTIEEVKAIIKSVVRKIIKEVNRYG